MRFLHSVLESLSKAESLCVAGELHDHIRKARNGVVSFIDLEVDPTEPIPMRLHCPECGKLHLDEGEFAEKPHHTHACQHCGLVWRPAKVNTVGVQFLPGYKNAATHDR